MQGHQGHVHQCGGKHRLGNADGDGLPAHVLELLQAELVADGEGDKAQRHLAEEIQRRHLLRGTEAHARQVQHTDTVGAQQQAGHQIRSHGGQVQLFGHTAHQQAAHQTDGQFNQNFHIDTSLTI